MAKSDAASRLARLQRTVSDLSTQEFEVPPPAVRTPLLLNGWVNFAPTQTVGDFQWVRYWKDASNQVHVQGLIKSGTLNVPIFYLQPGFRPATRILFVSIASEAVARVDVNADGSVVQVTGSAGSNIWLSLNLPPFLVT
jgi:hypothetical protein